MSLNDRLSRLEAGNASSKAARWRVDMERRKQGLAEATRKLAAMIEKELARRGIDPDHLPPQTPEEQAEAKRDLLQMLRARIQE